MKCNLFVLAISLLCLHGCASSTAYDLKWDAKTKINYRIKHAPLAAPEKIDFDVLANNPQLLTKTISDLNKHFDNELVLPMRLELVSAHNQAIDVLAYNTDVAYPTPATSDMERRKREFQKKMTGVVQLNARINPHGKGLDYAIKPQQQNLVSLLFYLPNQPVSVGDSWKVPVTLTSLNTPFIANEVKRVNKVWLHSVTTRDGVGRVAEIIYLVQEHLTGDRHQIATESPRPFTSSANYLAVGYYLIDQQKWYRYIGYLQTGVGALITTNMTVLKIDHDK